MQNVTTADIDRTEKDLAALYYGLGESAGPEKHGKIARVTQGTNFYKCALNTAKYAGSALTEPIIGASISGAMEIGYELGRKSVSADTGQSTGSSIATGATGSIGLQDVLDAAERIAEGGASTATDVRKLAREMVANGDIGDLITRCSLTLLTAKSAEVFENELLALFTTGLTLGVEVGSAR